MREHLFDTPGHMVSNASDASDYVLSWYFEPARRRSYLEFGRVVSRNWPPMLFGVVQEGGRARSLLSFFVRRRPVDIDDVAVYSGFGKVCLGETAAHLVSRKLLDPIDAFWMTGFSDRPRIVIDHNEYAPDSAARSIRYVMRGYDIDYLRLTY